MDRKTQFAGDLAPYGTTIYLPCRKFVDHPLRINFYSQLHLEELEHSIKGQGLLQPIVAWPIEDDNYQILSGHYRIRAMRRLRKEEIACSLFDGDKYSALRAYCTANLLSRKVSAIEEAFMIAGLIKGEGLNMKEIGELLGHDKSWVSRRVKLITDLDPQIKELVSHGTIKPRFAQELARLPQGNEQIRVLNIVRTCKMNKDMASELVTWWVRADEKERRQLEQSRIFPPRKKIDHQLDPAEHVAKTMRRCLNIIDGLIGFLKSQSKPFDWLPKSDFQSLQAAVESLARLIK